MKIFCHHRSFFFKHIKVTLQYLFNVVILLKTIFNYELNFKLKIDLKFCTFKNQKKKVSKPSGNPDIYFLILKIVIKFS